MLYTGISLVVGGGIGLCLSKAIIGKATIILEQAMNEERWNKTAFKVAGYGLLVLGMLIMIGSIGAIASVCGIMVGSVLPEGTGEIAFIAGTIFVGYFGRDYISRLGCRFAEWMNFSKIDAVT